MTGESNLNRWTNMSYIASERAHVQLLAGVEIVALEIPQRFANSLCEGRVGQMRWKLDKTQGGRQYFVVWCATDNEK